MAGLALGFALPAQARVPDMDFVPGGIGFKRPEELGRRAGRRWHLLSADRTLQVEIKLTALYRGADRVPVLQALEGLPASPMLSDAA